MTSHGDMGRALAKSTIIGVVVSNPKFSKKKGVKVEGLCRLRSRGEDGRPCYIDIEANGRIPCELMNLVCSRGNLILAELALKNVVVGRPDRRYISVRFSLIDARILSVLTKPSLDSAYDGLAAESLLDPRILIGSDYGDLIGQKEK